MDEIMPKMPHETDGLIFQPLGDVCRKFLLVYKCWHWNWITVDSHGITKLVWDNFSGGLIRESVEVRESIVELLEWMELSF